MTWVWVIVGGMVGAPARYLLDTFVQGRHDGDMPWGTFTVNMIASFVLGLVGAVTATPAIGLAVGTGFCGALSTYSTFAYENVRLLEDGRIRPAAVNMALSLVVGVLAAFAGSAVGSL